MQVLAAPTPSSPEEIAKARAAMEQKMTLMEAQPPVQPPPPTSPALPPAKRVKRQPETALAFPPLLGPPPAISAEKQQQLDVLLRKYRANEITPEQYHQERAKILGQP